MTTPENKDPKTAGNVQQTVDHFVRSILDDLREQRLELPMLPEIAMRVRKVVESDQASTSRIARIVSADAALSARLMRVANTAFYRRLGHVDTVNSAITLLGDRAVRGMVTGLVVHQLFSAKSPALRKRAETLWLHTAEVASISALLARQALHFSVDEAMLAGLVHDIGVMPLIARAEKYPLFSKYPAALDAVIGKLHGRIGRLIMESWKFPSEIVEVAEGHEDLGRMSATPDYVDIVTVANLHSYLGRSHPLGKADWGMVPAFAKLNLRPEQSVALIQNAQKELAELKQVLSG